MYLAMDRKPDNGAEMHNASFRQSGIIILVRIVKSERNEAEQEDD